MAISAHSSQQEEEEEGGGPRPGAHSQRVGVPESLTRHQPPRYMLRTGPLAPMNPPAPSKEEVQAPPSYQGSGPSTAEHPAGSSDRDPQGSRPPPRLKAASNPQQTGLMPKPTTNHLIQPSCVSKTELLSFASQHLCRRCGGDIWTAECF